MRETAVALAQKGFRVFPLVAGKKIPRIKNFSNVASSDPETVHRLWSTAVTGDDEGHNLGIATGHPGGVFVIDCDVKEGLPGLADLERFEAIGLDTSAKASTASGGVHVYQRLPAGVSVGNSAKKIGDGTDVRGLGGYVVAPGSATDIGAYKWIGEPPSIDAVPLAPNWLIMRCGAPTERDKDAHLPPPLGWDQPADIDRAIDYLKNGAPEGVSGFNGNDAAFKITMDVRDCGISDAQTAWLMLEHWNEAKAIPPWSPEELFNLVVGMHGRANTRAGSRQCTEFVPYDGPIGELPPKAGVDGGDATSELPHAEASTEGGTTAKPASTGKLRLETFDEAAQAATHSRSNYIVKDLLDAGATSVFYGPPNSGKTFVILELARCIATGSEFAGRATQQGAILYVALEGARGVRWRIAALQKHRPGEQSIPIILATGSLDLITDKNAFGSLTAAISEAAQQTGMAVKLAVVDTLARTMTGGNENDTADMTKIVDAAIRAAQQTGAHVMLVHHTGKDTSKGARGAYVLTGNIDSSFEVQPDKQQPGQPATGKIVNVKSRDNERQPPIAFRLEKVVAGMDGDLNTVTSCLVEFPVKLCRPASSLPKKLKLAVLALERATENGVRSVTTSGWNAAMDALAIEHGMSKLTEDQRGGLRRRAREEGFASVSADKLWTRISAVESRQNEPFSE